MNGVFCVPLKCRQLEAVDGKEKGWGGGRIGTVVISCKD